MNCERARELFSEYLEGDVEQAAAALVRSHLDQCPACAREVDALKRTWCMLNMLPQVESPVDFRHNVVMRAARLQHEQSKSKPRFAFNWDAFFGRLAPARAIAIACTGVLLAVLLLWVPPSAYEHVAGLFAPSATVVSPVEQSRPAVSAIEAQPLSMEAERKQEWQSRKLARNTVWVSVSPKETGEGTTIYRVTLSVNQAALLPDDNTQRIGASIYLLPANQFTFDAAKLADPEWKGNILPDSPVRVPVMLGDQGPGSVNLLVTWRFRQRDFADIIIIPSKRSSTSGDMFDMSVNKNEFTTGNDDLYSTLQTISQDYGVPVVANAYLDKQPSIVSFGKASLEEALIQTLKPCGLDWLAADRTVYVDRQYDVE